MLLDIPTFNKIFLMSIKDILHVPNHNGSSPWCQKVHHKAVHFFFLFPFLLSLQLSSFCTFPGQITCITYISLYSQKKMGELWSVYCEDFKKIYCVITASYTCPKMHKYHFNNRVNYDWQIGNSPTGNVKITIANPSSIGFVFESTWIAT